MSGMWNLLSKTKNGEIEMKKEKSSFEAIVCICVMAMVAFFLFLRDARGYAINKYVFIVLLAPVLLFAKEKYFYNVWAFIMPLYVGLPGNILTLVILFRFVLHSLSSRMMYLSTTQFCLSLLLAVYIFIQNILMGFTGIYHMIYVIEIVVLYFIMTAEFNAGFPSIFLHYSYGIALTGLIMLAYSLRVASFSELLSVASRLGDAGRTTSMTVIIDPNYYGMFAIISIAGNWYLATQKRFSRGQIVAAVAATSCALGVGIIGMSRAFILCVAIWSVLVFLTEKKMTHKIGIVLVAIVAIVLIFTILPESVDAVMARFEGDDMATGNGRTEQLVKYSKLWLETPITMLFGIGLFISEMHCMQFQMFTGLGIIGFLLIFAMYYSCWRIQRTNLKHFAWKSMVPLIVVQIAAATVPAARSLTFMMPVVMSILLCGEEKFI